MRLINDNEINYYTNLICERFLSYPQINHIYHNIEEDRKKEIMRIQVKLQIEAYAKHKCVYVLPDGEGIITGLKKPEVSELKTFFIHFMIMRKFSRHLTTQEKSIIAENSRKIKEIDDFLWYKKMKIKNSVHIATVAMSKEAKGTGAFRKLFQGYIDLVKRTNPNSPIILETHTKENTEIYEHFGFEVVKILEDENIDLKQYCMELK